MKTNEIIINEIKQSPATWADAITSGQNLGVLVGFEFEVCMPFNAFTDISTKTVDAWIRDHYRFSANPDAYDISLHYFDQLFKPNPELTSYTSAEDFLNKNEDSNDDYESVFNGMFGVSSRKIDKQFSKYFIYDPQEVYDNFIIDSPYYSDFVSGNSWSRSTNVVAKNLKEVFQRKVNVFYDAKEATKNLTNWYIEPDSSINPSDEGDEAMEIVSPPYPAQEAITVLSQFYRLATKLNLYTGKEYGTGLHINVSIPRNLDILKLILVTGDRYVLQKWGREYNPYVKKTYDRLVDQLSVDRNDQLKTTTGDVLPVTGIASTSRIFSDTIVQIAGDLTANHYSSISLEDGNKYISFRHAGGDYLNRPGDVVNTVGRFVQAMIIASDPQMYAREYAAKLAKLLSIGKTVNNAKGADVTANLVNYIRTNGLPVYKIDFAVFRGSKPANVLKALKDSPNYSSILKDKKTTYELLPDSADAKAELYAEADRITRQQLGGKLRDTDFYQYLIIPGAASMIHLVNNTVFNNTRAVKNTMYPGPKFTAKGSRILLPVNDPRTQQYITYLLRLKYAKKS